MFCCVSYLVIEVDSLITVIRNYLVVLTSSSQLITISSDLDNLLADEKQLETDNPLKSVLNMKFKTLVSEILKAKRMEDSGDNGLWLQVKLSCEFKPFLKPQEINLCLGSKASLRILSH